VSLLRLPSRRADEYTPAGPKIRDRESFISLGKTIVVLYLAALMAAMISARVLPEGEFDRPEVRAIEATNPPPIILDS
jgi:hypothetical protein